VRVRVLGLLVGVTAASLPPPLRAAFADLKETTRDQWSAPLQEATFAEVTQWFQAHVPAGAGGGRVGIPCMVVALTREEALAMHAGGRPFFDAFGRQADDRWEEFVALRRSVPVERWPEQYYDPERESWHPFGPDRASIQSIAANAVRSVNNAAAGTRERRELGQTKLTLLRYRLDEFLPVAAQVHGERAPVAEAMRENIRRVSESGCLILLDDFSLLHPLLRPHIDALLALPANLAVVSISAGDPSHSPLRNLLQEGSYLRVGNMFSRFSQAEDLRWELAINSIERLQRWLRVVLPELSVALGQQQPLLVDKVNEILQR